MNEAAGIVVALQANYLEVELDQAPEQAPSRLLCTRRTRLTHRGEAVHVGDRVMVEAIDPVQARAVVSGVAPRTSWLTRPQVAKARSDESTIHRFARSPIERLFIKIRI